MARRPRSLLLALTLLLGMTLLVAEALVRVLDPFPRVLVVRTPYFLDVRTLDGIPVWAHQSGRKRLWTRAREFATGLLRPRHPSTEPRRWDVVENLDCASDTRVLVLGDSIFHGIGLPAAEVASVLWQQRLRAEGIDACVHNLSVPGYNVYTQTARATEAVPMLRPRLVVFEVWGGEPRPPTRVGDTIYFFEDLEVDATGLPNPLGLPAPLNRGLLRTSDFYEYALLASTPRCESCRPGWGAALPRLDRLRADIATQGGELVFAIPAYLQGGRAGREASENAPLLEYAARHEVPVLRLWEALDPAALQSYAMDSVHLNAAGQGALAEIWHRELTPYLGDTESPAPDQ